MTFAQLRDKITEINDVQHTEWMAATIGKSPIEIFDGLVSGMIKPPMTLAAMTYKALDDLQPEVAF